MIDYQQQIQELLDRAGELDHGPTQIALIEEAVNIADSHHDDDLGYEVRLQLIDATEFGGRTDMSLIVFPWLLAKSDSDPDRFDNEPLLWRYKWIVNSAKRFPTITLAQIDALFADMHRRHQEAGSTMHAYWDHQREHAVARGDRDAAMHADDEMRKAGRDHLSNCKACVQEAEIEFQTFLGNYEAAITASKPIFRGRMSCGEVPERTHGIIIRPLIMLRKHEEIIQHFKTGYRLVSMNPSFLSIQGLHILGLAVTDNLARAITLLQRHWPEFLVSTNLDHQFDFALYTRVLLECLAKHGDDKARNRAAEILQSKSENLNFDDCIRMLDDRLTAIASAFDHRNRTSEYSRRHQSFREYLDYVVPTPLVGSKS